MPGLLHLKPASVIADMLDVHINTLLAWRQYGLTGYRVGKRVWFDTREVESYIKAMKNEPWFSGPVGDIEA